MQRYGFFLNHANVLAKKVHFKVFFRIFMGFGGRQGQVEEVLRAVQRTTNPATAH